MFNGKPKAPASLSAGRRHQGCRAHARLRLAVKRARRSPAQHRQFVVDVKTRRAYPWPRNPRTPCDFVLQVRDNDLDHGREQPLGIVRAFIAAATSCRRSRASRIAFRPNVRRVETSTLTRLANVSHDGVRSAHRPSPESDSAMDGPQKSPRKELSNSPLSPPLAGWVTQSVATPSIALFARRFRRANLQQTVTDRTVHPVRQGADAWTALQSGLLTATEGFRPRSGTGARATGPARLPGPTRQARFTLGNANFNVGPVCPSAHNRKGGIDARPCRAHPTT